MTGRRLLAALLGVTASVTLAACGSDASSTVQTGSVAAGGAVTPGVTAAPASADVPETLRFTAPLVGGGTYDGASASGKVTAYWFWAPT